ncbi:MAG TPA: response regulator transcription factor [Gemmatimonadales bacterium]|jgi:DNA-binding NarL/FixJ family response regulator|nr:response regulator transcription factor [Gemmatimonadales bacterium]
MRNYPQDPTLSVLVADDDTAFAQALEAMMAHWYYSVGIVTQLADLTRRIRAAKPAIVVLDMKFGDHSSVARLPELRRHNPATQFVMYSAYVRPEYVEAAFENGASAYVSKLDDLEEIHAAIEAVRAGGTYVSPDVHSRAHVDRHATDTHIPADDIEPTPQQLAVLRLLRYGYPIAVVAERLKIAVKTVDEHLHQTKLRTGINSRARLIRWAEKFLDRTRDQPGGPS